MEKLKNITIVILLALVLLTPTAWAKSPVVLLQEGLYAEEIEGNLDKAIEIYEEVIEEASEIQRIASRATYQLGLCYLKKGQKDQAAKYFQQVISNFPTQKTLTRKATRQLKKITPVKDIIAKSYVIHYKAIDQSKNALELLNKNHPRGVRTHHANRYRKNSETINSICTDNEIGKDKIVAAINDNDELELVKVESPKTTKSFQPVVINAIPANYANDIPVSLDKITVTFDRPMMDDSWSWTGGGETFPEITGKIHYDNSKTTCTLPVKLKAGNVYWIGINSPSHKNFKTQQRVPAKRHVIIFSTNGENGSLTPIPKDMLAKAKKINAIKPTRLYTQKSFNNIQPDGTIKARVTVTKVNKSGQTLNSYSFINSDFVHVTKMYDANGVELQYSEKHEGDNFRYNVQLNEPWKPGDVQQHTHESVIYGLIKPIEGLENAYRYYMRHWPGTDELTKRIETYLLPEGAELISMIPPNMKQNTVRGRIRLHHEETIRPGTSITTSFQYHLADTEIEYEDISSEQVEKIVQRAVNIISTCAEGDPKVKNALDSLKPIKPQLVLKKINEHLDSESPTKRRSAIYIIWRGGFKDIAAVEQKLNALCSHEETFTRGMAALALGEGQAISSFDVLKDMTLNDNDGYARRCGAYALGLLADIKALPVLEKALDDSDPMVKANAEAAITMLTELKDR